MKVYSGSRNLFHHERSVRALIKIHKEIAELEDYTDRLNVRLELTGGHDIIKEDTNRLSNLLKEKMDREGNNSKKTFFRRIRSLRAHFFIWMRL